MVKNHILVNSFLEFDSSYQVKTNWGREKLVRIAIYSCNIRRVVASMCNVPNCDVTEAVFVRVKHIVYRCFIENKIQMKNEQNIESQLQSGICAGKYKLYMQIPRYCMAQ